MVDSASWGNKSHCVDYDNIKLSDIYRYSSEEFLRVRGCGIATVAELAAILRKYNVIPPGDLAKWDRIDTH